MLERLEELQRTHKELTGRLSDPGIFEDPGKFKELSIALAEIAPVVKLYEEYKDIQGELAENEELIGELSSSDELWDLAQAEREDLANRIDQLTSELKQELVPKDPDDEKNVVLEIRAGTGGDEATLFAAELFRMYARFAEEHRWKVDIIDLSESGVGGYKEVSAIIEGRGVFRMLRYEAGVHRVQRVPSTETSGRIHTSAVTVAVLPESEDVEIEVDEKDLRSRSLLLLWTGWAGRQHHLFGSPPHSHSHGPW